MTPNLHDILETFQQSLWLPDAGVVHLALATVAANRLPGDPLWLLIVGPPSSGKTVALDALSDLPEFHPVSTFTEAGLLSGSSGNNGGTGGLLRQVGDRGLIVASDFGTLLNEHGSTRNRLFACLREVYDGKFVRQLGTEGGRTYAWVGHAGFVGACTEAIDSPAIDLGLLGERFTYYRMPEASPNDEHLTCLVANERAGHQPADRAKRASAVAEFFAGLDLPDTLPMLDEEAENRLITLAGIGARCRSSVVREGFSREVEMVPGRERSTRLFGQLRQLHAGLVVIGTEAAETWRLVTKAALDGIPPGRRAAMDYLMAERGEHATAVVAGHLRLPVTPTRRHLQDLYAHGVVDLSGDHPERWSASEWLVDHWWAATSAAGAER